MSIFRRRAGGWGSLKRLEGGCGNRTLLQLTSRQKLALKIVSRLHARTHYTHLDARLRKGVSNIDVPTSSLRPNRPPAQPGRSARPLEERPAVPASMLLLSEGRTCMHSACQRYRTHVAGAHRVMDNRHDERRIGPTPPPPLLGWLHCTFLGPLLLLRPRGAGWGHIGQRHAVAICHRITPAPALHARECNERPQPIDQLPLRRRGGIAPRCLAACAAAMHPIRGGNGARAEQGVHNGQSHAAGAPDNEMQTHRAGHL